ncbi:MAG: hypothetical protein Q7R47_00675 [Candidatus Diapherotrites archaeon]|nr:hypothetical protein [Candidatus Diapherotrites archaeon]
MMSGIRKSLLLWGVICLIGFGVFEFWQTSIALMNSTLILLAMVGIFLVTRFVPNAFSNRAIGVFIGLFLVGLIVSFLWDMGTPVVLGLHAPFATLWLALFAISFLWAGYYFKEQGWYLAGLLQLVVLVALVVNVGPIVAHAFGLLAITTGVPLLLFGYKH